MRHGAKYSRSHIHASHKTEMSFGIALGTMCGRLLLFLCGSFVFCLFCCCFTVAVVAVVVVVVAVV